jgi:outer membrane protein OmpA-like peptidoglycan-associated protein
MKQKFATIATGIAMPISQRNNKFTLSLLLIGICFSLSSIAQKSNNVNIFGTAKDKAGLALSNVQVKFDGIDVASTNEEGSYTFTVEKETGKMYQILFIKDGFNRAVRTYNAEMTDLNFSVKMVVPCKCNTVDKCVLQNVQFDFDKESNQLNKTQKQQLDELIACLKLQPEKEVTVHYNTLYPKKQIGGKRLAAVLNYFLQKGIMNDRVKSETVTNKTAAAKQIEIY